MPKKKKITRRVSPKSGDPADLTFFSNLFSGIAEEMGVILSRTAYSPNIKERRDLSCAIFDGKGKLIAQAAHIPVHLGSMQMSAQAVLATFDSLEEGDVVILNDPFAGGTHLPDITMMTPVMNPVQKPGKKKSPRPFVYLVSRAHHADVGGASPGSMPIAREIFEEGLRLPPVKLRDGGVLNQGVLDILTSNVRTPEERMGDLRAQLASHAGGTKRMSEVLLKYGSLFISARLNELHGYARDLMKAFISKIPNGTYIFEDFLEDDGFSARPLRIRVNVFVKGRRVVVDFKGSDPACSGNLNAVESITWSSVYYCFLSFLVSSLKGKTDPFLNAGCFDPIAVLAPEGSIVNAPPGSAVGGGNVETSQRIVDVVFGAMAKALPNLVPAASQGTMNNLTLGGIDPKTNRPFSYYETIAGGSGGRPTKNGVDGVPNHMTTTMNTPVEALEFSYPLRVERYKLAPNTGGKGKYQGGCGIHRDIRVLSDVRGTLISERRKIAPYGLHGGKPGKVGMNQLIRKGGRQKLPGKTELDLKAGDIVRLKTPGGGGWGQPNSKRKK